MKWKYITGMGEYCWALSSPSLSLLSAVRSRWFTRESSKQMSWITKNRFFFWSLPLIVLLFNFVKHESHTRTGFGSKCKSKKRFFEHPSQTIIPQFRQCYNTKQYNEVTRLGLITCLRFTAENFDVWQCIHVSALSSGIQCAATALCCELFPSKWFISKMKSFKFFFANIPEA